MKKMMMMLVMMFAVISNVKAEVVFSGEHNVASWNAKQLPVGDYAVLAKASAGDVIAVTVTAVEDGARVTLQDISWQGMADEYNCAVGIHYFSLTEAMATKLNEGGLIVTGEKYTFNKVELLYRQSLWKGTVDDNSGWGQSDALPNALFTDLTEGSVLGIDVTAINDGETWHQVALRVDYADNLIATSISEAKTLLFNLNADQVTTLQTKTINVIAQYLKVSGLCTYVTEKENDSPVIWEGEKVFGSAWSAWEQIAASAFANAQEGYLLRTKFKNLQAGATLKLSTSAWNDMPDAEIANLSGVYQQYTITSNMLNELKANGMIVSGVGFTMTSIEILDPATLKTLTISVPVSSNWVFEGKPSITVHVENPYNEAVVANVAIAITTDKMAEVTTINKKVEIAANGNDDIVLSTTDNLEAGIYKATCTVNDDLARAFFFAVNPTDIVSAPDKQADFDTFWSTAKSQLDNIDINATLTEITSKSTAKRKVYLVEMQSVPDGLTGDPVTVRGYYCEPTDGKQHPVIMHYLGYDSGYRPGGQDAMPYCPSGDAEPDYAEFYLSCRGQSINNRPASDRDDGIDRDFENTYGDWFAFNFGQKDSYYYRGAYMDCVRAIDFMATRETSDMSKLYAEGQSQGGAFTVAAAALSGRTFQAIAPAITFMGDFPDYFEITNWPASVAREKQGTMTDEEMFAFLSYFDTKNLATRISCPIITSVGIQDNVCPAHTNLAPYNNVTTAEEDKQVVFNAELQHQVNGDWYSDYMTFFETYAPADEDVEVIWEGTQATGDWEAYIDLASWTVKTELANARMNDILRIAYTIDGEYPHVCIANPNGWNAISEADVETSGNYDFTIESASNLEIIQMNGIIVNGKNITITDVQLLKADNRYDAVPMTISSDGIASFGSSKNLDFSGISDVTPYYVSEVSTGVVNLTSVEITRGWAGYIVKGTPGTYDVPVAASEPSWIDAFNYLIYTGDYDGNWVYRSVYSDYDKGGERETKIKTYYRYILEKNNSNEIGFFKLAENFTEGGNPYHVMGAHKAYLETPSDITPSGSSARIALNFDGETTGINITDNEQDLDEPSGKTGYAGAYYNLAGQRIAKPVKGLYIKNGKKYFVK